MSDIPRRSTGDYVPPVEMVHLGPPVVEYHGPVGIARFRPTTEMLMLEFARLTASRSTCRRNKVGAIITDLEMLSVLAYGYNGNARGLPNECDRPEDPGGCGCIHAEANALIKAPGLTPKLLFTSVAPCLACAKLAVNAFVERVTFTDAYRTTAGIALLMAAGVEVVQLDAIGRPSWRSRYDSISALKPPPAPAER